MAYLIGAFFGDGCCYQHNGNHQFSITSEDKDFCLTCQTICTEIFNKAGKIKTITKGDKISYYQLVICSKKICDFISEVTEKKTNIPILKTTEEQLAFIQGFMDADGWISERHPSDGHIRYSIGVSNTAAWLKDIYDIFLDLNIKVGKFRKEKCFRYNKQTKDRHTFSINSIDYCTRIGFCIKRKQDIAQKCLLSKEIPVGT